MLDVFDSHSQHPSSPLELGLELLTGSSLDAAEAGSPGERVLISGGSSGLTAGAGFDQGRCCVHKEVFREPAGLDFDTLWQRLSSLLSLW